PQIYTLSLHDALPISKKLLILKLVKGKRWLLGYLVLWGILAAAAVLLWAPVWYYWVAGATVGALVAGAGLHVWLQFLARNRVKRDRKSTSLNSSHLVI